MKHDAKKIRTSVTLLKHTDDEKHMFYCCDCRNAILQYKGEVVSIEPGFTEVELPVIIECSNKNCKRKYQFNYFAEKN